MPPPLALGEAARGFAQLGIPVFMLNFPLPGRPSQCSCGSGEPAGTHSTKHPLTHPKLQLRHGLYEATTDLETIDMWWRIVPDANIGARTGVVFDVVDFDSLEAFLSFRRTLEGEERAAFDRAPTAITGRRGTGVHKYFLPSHLPSATKFLPDIDLKAGGDPTVALTKQGNGYVALPPSRHASGKQYHWKPRSALQSMSDLEPLIPTVRSAVEHHLTTKRTPTGARTEPIATPLVSPTALHPAFRSRTAQERFVARYVENLRYMVVERTTESGRLLSGLAALDLGRLVATGLLERDRAEHLARSFIDERSRRTGRQKDERRYRDRLARIDEGLLDPLDLSLRLRRSELPSFAWRPSLSSTQCVADASDGKLIVLSAVEHAETCETTGWNWRILSVASADGIRSCLAEGTSPDPDLAFASVLSALGGFARKHPTTTNAVPGGLEP